MQPGAVSPLSKNPISSFIVMIPRPNSVPPVLPDVCRANFVRDRITAHGALHTIASQGSKQTCTLSVLHSPLKETVSRITTRPAYMHLRDMFLSVIWSALHGPSKYDVIANPGPSIRLTLNEGPLLNRSSPCCSVNRRIVSHANIVPRSSMRCCAAPLKASCFRLNRAPLFLKVNCDLNSEC